VGAYQKFIPKRCKVNQKCAHNQSKGTIVPDSTPLPHTDPPIDTLTCTSGASLVPTNTTLAATYTTRATQGHVPSHPPALTPFPENFAHPTRALMAIAPRPRGPPPRRLPGIPRRVPRNGVQCRPKLHADRKRSARRSQEQCVSLPIYFAAFFKVRSETNNNNNNEQNN